MTVGFFSDDGMARRVRPNLNSVNRAVQRNALKAAINNSLRAYMNNPQSNANLQLQKVNNATKALIRTYVEEQQAAAYNGNGGNKPLMLMNSNKPSNNGLKKNNRPVALNGNSGNNGNPLGVGNLANNGTASAGKSKYNGITTKLNTMKKPNAQTYLSLNALKRAVKSNANSNAKTAMLQKITNKKANLDAIKVSRNVTATAITAVKNANTEARVQAVEAAKNAENAERAAQAARNANTAAAAANAEQKAREAANKAARNAAEANAAAKQIAANEAANAAEKQAAANAKAAANKAAANAKAAANKAANAAKRAAAAASGRNKLRVAASTARAASLLKLAGNASASRRNALLKTANTSIFNGFVSEITGAYGATDPLYKIRGRVNASSNLNNTQKGNLRQKISDARLGTFKRNVAKATTTSDLNGRIAKHLQTTSRTHKILTNNHKAEAAAYLKNKRQSLNSPGPSPNAPVSGGPNNNMSKLSLSQLNAIIRLTKARLNKGQGANGNKNRLVRATRLANALRPKKKGLFGHIGGAIGAVGGAAVGSVKAAGGAAKYVVAGTAHHATQAVKAAAPYVKVGVRYNGQKKVTKKIPNTKIGNNNRNRKAFNAGFGNEPWARQL
jgi:chemotaxis protein histidine kinase CheA